jgi:hypothetical protein
MTKVSILGQEEGQKQGKPIEFIRYLEDDSGFHITSATPKEWRNVVLIQKKYGQFDLIYAYDKNPGSGTLYLGHWNDGYVEE